jgi:hypothetical protein
MSLKACEGRLCLCSDTLLGYCGFHWDAPLPSRKLYPYLTDRIGNYEELEPYFDVWRSVNINEGFLAIFVVEHDTVDSSVPQITKGTDGRALI